MIEEISIYGNKKITANRGQLRELMPGYGEEILLLDDLEVTVDSDNKIVEIKAVYQYDPIRSGYFEAHFGGLFPGLGGHGEFMAQTSAGGSVLSGLAGRKILLLGIDNLRMYSPVRGKRDLICVSRPIDHPEVNNAFSCSVYSNKEYTRIKEESRLLSRATVLGISIS